jgi:hypothetical protein
MRMPRALVLHVLVWLPLLALGSHGASAFVHAVRPSPAHERGLIVEAVLECGMFDGKFQCRSSRGGKQFGKNAPPAGGVESQDSSPEGMPSGGMPGTDAGQPVQGGSPDSANACQGGMVGTPPNCQCPENSELLGGNCVRYTASACSSGLAADALPQACRSVEEKLSCKLRADGLKDCCCITYDKF